MDPAMDVITSVLFQGVALLFSVFMIWDAVWFWRRLRRERRLK